ncbi:MAG: hypothetical protein ABMA64_14425 [Myxococcota bacterium]
MRHPKSPPGVPVHASADDTTSEAPADPSPNHAATESGSTTDCDTVPEHPGIDVVTEVLGDLLDEPVTTRPSTMSSKAIPGDDHPAEDVVTAAPVDITAADHRLILDEEVDTLIAAIGKAVRTTTIVACLLGAISTARMLELGKGRHKDWRDGHKIAESTDYLYRRLHSLRLEAIKTEVPTMSYPVGDLGVGVLAEAAVRLPIAWQGLPLKDIAYPKPPPPDPPTPEEVAANLLWEWVGPGQGDLPTRKPDPRLNPKALDKALGNPIARRNGLDVRAAVAASTCLLTAIRACAERGEWETMGTVATGTIGALHTLLEGLPPQHRPPPVKPSPPRGKFSFGEPLSFGASPEEARCIQSPGSTRSQTSAG